ncbi:hypothetical protein Nepgr_013810 [Nepenthes gracilis]|uniref:Protodermal factor 1 n=1 Tax=Nepenthes gracilis TaxID=150966 RepID=A0AAD3XPI9_NEPGR|nr:hypothetical protein Nepgr_013810 [Nepenthes gracilis]
MPIFEDIEVDIYWFFTYVVVVKEFSKRVTSFTFENQKNYYSPDPHVPATPTGSHHHSSHGSPPPYGGFGGGSPPSYGGFGGGSPPSHGGSGGGSCSPTRPSTSPPSSGYYHSPPSTPSTPPVVIPPPTPDLTPVTPSAPSPPFTIDPNSPPFTCVYWRNHPTLIWGLLGWWGTVGGAFGVASLPGLHAGSSLLQALSDTRTDGFGALYREGTASLLNSMVDSKFPFTAKQVRDSFAAALSSNKAAAAQARVFKLANENRLPASP